MSKRTKKERGRQASVPAQDTGISKRGKKVILCGIATIALGFIVLTQTDSRGQNLASKLSPLLILGGYATVAFGIFVPDPID